MVLGTWQSVGIRVGCCCGVVAMDRMLQDGMIESARAMCGFT